MSNGEERQREVSAYMRRMEEEKKTSVFPIITCPPFFEPMNRQTHEDKNVVRDSIAMKIGNSRLDYRENTIGNAISNRIDSPKVSTGKFESTNHTSFIFPKISPLYKGALSPKTLPKRKIKNTSR